MVEIYCVICSMVEKGRKKDKKSVWKICYFKNNAYLCIAIAKIAQLVEHNLAKVGVAGSSPVFRSKRTMKYINLWKEIRIAKIAQLVEHNLAKVGVAGSSPVFRSNFFWNLRSEVDARPGGGIGRHATLRG